MAVEDAVEVRVEAQATRDLPQTSGKDTRTRRACGREILWIAGVANQSIGRDPLQQQRGRCHAGCANHQVSGRGILARDFHFCSSGFEFIGQSAQPFPVARAQLHAPYMRRQAARTARANIARSPDNQQCCTAQATAFAGAHFSQALHNESDRQAVAGGEGRACTLREPGEVSLDQDGTESAQADNLSPGSNSASGGASHPGQVVVQIAVPQTVGSNERIDVKSPRGGAGDGARLNVAHRPGRDPGQDVADLLFGQRRVVWAAQHGQHIGCRAPALLVPDAGEIYTGFTIAVSSQIALDGAFLQKKPHLIEVG